MSLLIKALEQAAKDRDAASKAETPGVDGTSGRNVTSLTDTAQRRTAGSLSGLSQIEAQQRARAASVVQATESRGSHVLNYLRGNPVAMIGGLALVLGVLFGVYVYVQVANPGLLARQPPPGPATPPAPPPGAPVADATPAPSAPTPPTPPAAPATVTALPEPPRAPAALPAPANMPTASGSPQPAAPAGAIPTGSVIGAAPAPAPAAAPPSASGFPPATTLSPAPISAAAPREPAPARETRESSPEPRRESRPPAAAAAARERIMVSAGNTKPVMNPLLGTAYAALQAGDLEQARSAYKRVSDAEPLNIDAMLGLAFIATQENRMDDAMREYLRILQLDPRNTVAQGAMIGLVGRADPVAAETRVKQLIAREPSSFLHFILGNVYADQSAWPQAQQSFFQAQALEPDNADYAYNLAVSLDHLRQSKLALNYYRRAETLASARGRANFNVSQARERIRSLSGQVE